MWNDDGTFNVYMLMELGNHRAVCKVCKPRPVETLELPEFEDE
jgi:hypothetical protein